MSARALHRSRAVGGRVEAGSSTHALTAGESAWLAALPCALVLLAAIVVLGPPLGRALLGPPAASGIWERFVVEGLVRPEPTEHARYLVALAGPLLVCGGMLALRGSMLRDATAAALTRAGKALLVAFVVGCLVYQHVHVGEFGRAAYFTVPTLLVSLAFAAVAAVVLHAPRASARIAGLLRETTAKRAGAVALAALFVGTWLLTAYDTDGTIGRANYEMRINIPWWIDEAGSLLDGHAPLVDFHAQYGQLWAYVSAGGMELLGASLAVYSAIMLAGTAGALAAIFATLRRLAGSSLAGLALFLPFIATSFFAEAGPLANRYGPANLYSLFPMRYGGPFVLLWLVVRRVARGGGRPPVALFALGGLVAINNVEFGVPALAGTLAAFAWTTPRSRAALAWLLGSAAAGLVAAVVLVAALTLAVAGSLPHLGMLSTFPRLYGRDGLDMLPMPVLGLHLVLYVTFAAALVLASVRALAREGEDERPLTAALAWAGVFGLGAGVYFVGRSHPDVLIDLFTAWALALALLLVVVVRAIVRRPSRRAGVVELLVLAGFGLAACSLAQTPTPWSQIERLGATAPDQVAVTTRLVARLTQRGEAVALLVGQGHRIAARLGLDDVAPYSFIDAMVTRAQWEETVAALRAAGGHRLIVPEDVFQEQADWLLEHGFRPYFRSARVIAFSRP